MARGRRRGGAANPFSGGGGIRQGALEDMTFSLNVTGQEQASRKVRNFSKDVGNLDKAAAAAGGKFGSLAGAVGNVGTIVASTSPQFSQFAGVIGTAGSAVGGLTSAIGGVGGLLTGGLIAALGVLVVKKLQARDAAADLDNTLRRLERSHADLTSRMREQFPQTMDDVTRAVRRTNAELIELDKRIAELSKPSTLELIFGNIGSERARRQREAAGLRFRQQQLRRRQGQEGVPLDRQIASLEQTQQDRFESEVARFGGRRRAGAARAGAGGGIDQFRAQSEVRTGAAAELQALGFIGGDAGAPAAPDAGAFGGTSISSEEIAKLTKLDTSAVDRTEELDLLAKLDRAVQDKERNEQNAIRQTMQVRQEATNLALAGAQQALTQAILGNELGARAALKATGDALVGQGVSHLFQSAAMAFVPGAQGNAAGLAAAAAAEIAAGKAMGAVFAPPSGASSGGARATASPTRPDPGLFVQVNVNPLTGEQMVKTLRAERRQRGDNAVAF